MDFETGSTQFDRRISALLPRFSDANRAAALDYLKVRSLTLKPATLYNYAHLLCIVDDHLNGKPFRAMSRDDVLTFLLHEKQRVSQTSVVTRTRCLKRFLLDTRGKLSDDFLAVLRTRDPPPPDKANIVTDEQFRGLLAACNDIRGPRWFDRTTHAQALLWFLWDTGFRIAEALSVRFCDIHIEGDMARIKLDPEAPQLKTGPRTIEVVECVPVLRAWMSLHPYPDPQQPLWITTKRQTPPTAMGRKGADDLVKLLWRKAAIQLHGSKALSCHDFRHTSATRRARQGWGEADLRLFHGWSRDSKMPSRYVHKAQNDLRELVRRDAGLAPSGTPEVAKAGMKTCPMCAEDVKAAARKCKHCGSHIGGASVQTATATRA